MTAARPGRSACSTPCGWPCRKAGRPEGRSTRAASRTRSSLSSIDLERVVVVGDVEGGVAEGKPLYFVDWIECGDPEASEHRDEHPARDRQEHHRGRAPALTVVSLRISRAARVRGERLAERPRTSSGGWIRCRVGQGLGSALFLVVGATGFGEPLAETAQAGSSIPRQKRCRRPRRPPAQEPRVFHRRR
jgi:hypothetical protein